MQSQSDSSAPQTWAGSLPGDKIASLGEERLARITESLRNVASRPESFDLSVAQPGLPGGEGDFTSSAAVGSSTPPGAAAASGAAPGGVPGATIEVCLVAREYPYLFSVLSGILSASGFETQSGTILTTQAVDGNRFVVDIFQGTLSQDLDFGLWSAEFTAQLGRVLALYPAQLPDSPQARAEAVRPVRRAVIEEVAAALRHAQLQVGKIMAPMSIDIVPDEGGKTRLKISSDDTPFFLYSLSVALSLHRVSIDSIEIRTENGRARNTIDIIDTRGNAITDKAHLSRIRLSILLSKQFTYFVDRAPDPLQALERFDELVQSLSSISTGQDIMSFLSDVQFQKELALLLGASDFIWEDFIRVQQENILPMLKAEGERKLLSAAPEDVDRLLDETIEKAAAAARAAGATSAASATRGGKSGAAGDSSRVLEAKVAALNEFKDRQSYLVDLDHILVQELDFFFLSRRLTALAEAVVRTALKITWDELTSRAGVPRTAAGLPAEWAVFGLGKLGGRALGYASDIELLFIFSDNGETDGPEPWSNREFFERFFREAALKIQSRREGIFQVDLRLRPHGEDGPVAVNLQNFIEYFSSDGGAHSAERLALVRMRWIGGSPNLGSQVSSIRDRIIYEEDSIKVAELRELRLKQIADKLDVAPRAQGGVRRHISISRAGERPQNAKFSPGALVDLEYNVQILQIINGRTHKELRVPGIHSALQQLTQIGTIDADEASAMTAAYQFFRKLINGLRMLRGNAHDLFMPSPSSLEYRYLARRIGYVRTSEQSEAEMLHIDFENHTAEVRRFVERHLGRDAIPVQASGTIVDIVLGESVADELISSVLSQAQFENHRRALVNIKSLAGEGEQRRLFARLAVLVWDSLCASPDPDAALNNWEQFVRRLPDPSQHFRQLLDQPKRAALLLSLFGVSQFLSDVLVQNPGFFEWITDPRIVSKPRDQISMEADLRAQAEEAADRLDWINRLRVFRKREILRIGLRDLGIGAKIEEITGEISFLARACCELALEQAQKRMLAEADAAQRPVPVPRDLKGFSICGFGKLGGYELNYSSDIDLVAVYEPVDGSRNDAEDRWYTRLVQAFIQDLSDFTREGQAFRVDFRLRPFGATAPLVCTRQSFLDYYRNSADVWEIQALIKLQPVAGDLSLGQDLLSQVRERILEPREPQLIISNIARMRALAIREHIGDDDIVEVKNGPGGLRDIEFLVQALQFVHARENPALLKGNSLRAIRQLTEAGLLTPEESANATLDYTFLRKIEHYLQLAQDRQLHAIPTDPKERERLAKAMAKELEAYAGLGLAPGAGPEPGERFAAILDAVMKRVRAKYLEHIGAG